MRRLGSLGVCLALGIGLVWPVSEASAAANGKVVVIVMENAAYGDVVGSTQAPYLNQLASGGQLFTNYAAVAPASNPNYLAMTSGLTSASSPPSPNMFQAGSVALIHW
jgi:phosphatidylinositol-3-phosphatase